MPIPLRKNLFRRVFIKENKCMTDPGKHKILIVDSSQDIRERIKRVLSLKKFKVYCVSSAENVFTALDKVYENPFAVIISGSQMPKMKGDILLKKAKEYSPETRRMLLADASDIEIIINAINIAEIQGCLSIPFSDEELIHQVNERCKEFEAIEKKKMFKRITGTQNKQLYKIALNFKKKERFFINQIEKKKKRIRILKSKISVESEKNKKYTPENLEKFIDQKNIHPSPENFANEFINMKNRIKDILTGIISNISESPVNLSDVDYKTIAENRGSTQVSDVHHFGSGELIEIISKLVFKSYETTDPEIDKTDYNKTDYNKIDYNKIDYNKPEHQPQENSLDDYLELIIGEDRLTGFIKIKKPLLNTITIDAIKEYLKTNKIQFGIKDDQLIKIWLAHAKVEDDPFVIAKGITPEFPVNSKIKYYFKTDYKKAGKILSDGSIDFKDRGDIPFVTKDTLLAEKTMAVKGRSGVDIFGDEIPVGEPIDLFFDCGTGTRFSEDKLKIFADSDGMPHQDAMGRIAVLSELTVQDDVDFETGNIDFNGNVVVKGGIKAGFSIKCANLTIKDIDGAEIDITGDLNVISGIVNADIIKVQGTVKAQYVNNSKIKAFGDIIIQKEIIDSKLLLSGACINERGHIISSYISAKRGIIAGSIGTAVSLPSTLKAGLNEHIKFFMNRADKKLNENIEAIKAAKKKIAELETENNDLNMKIAEQAFIQDQSEIKLRDIEKKLSQLKASEDITELNRTSEIINELKRKIINTGKEFDIAFIRQDKIMQEIEDKKKKIKEYEADNKKLLRHKKKLKNFAKKHEPVAEVKVNKKIMPGTLIVCPNSNLRIQQIESRCRIMEVKMKEEENGSVTYYKIDISNL